MPSTDVLSGLLVLTLSTLAYFQSKPFSYLGGVFVRWVALILFGLGATLVIKGILRGEKLRFWKPDSHQLDVLIVAVLLIIYVLLLHWLGFVVTSILIFSALSLLLSPKAKRKTAQAWLLALVTSVTVTLLFYGVFRYGLLVPLPQGVIFG